MTREQILRAYLQDELLLEKGYLKEGEGESAKWADRKNNKMVDVVKFAIEGVLNRDSQTLMTRKINQFLENN
jgi:hypothetical protein